MLLDCKGNVKLMNGNILKQVDSFKYLGSEIPSTEKMLKQELAKLGMHSISLQWFWNPMQKYASKETFSELLLRLSCCIAQRHGLWGKSWKRN